MNMMSEITLFNNAELKKRVKTINATVYLLFYACLAPLLLNVSGYERQKFPSVHLLNRLLFEFLQDSDVLFFEGFELVIELIMPRVKDEDLESEGRGGDSEVDKGDSARDDHCVEKSLPENPRQSILESA